MSASSQPSAQSSQATTASSAQRTAEARAAFTASLTSVGSSLDAELQARAKNIHENAEALGKQEKDLREQTQSLSNDSDDLEKLLEQTKGEISSFGDMEAMMANIDADLELLEETLRIAEHHDDSDEEAAPEDTQHLAEGTGIKP